MKVCKAIQKVFDFYQQEKEKWESGKDSADQSKSDNKFSELHASAENNDNISAAIEKNVSSMSMVLNESAGITSIHAALSEKQVETLTKECISMVSISFGHLTIVIIFIILFIYYYCH